MTVGFGDRRTSEGRDEELQAYTDRFCSYVELLGIDPDDFAFMVQEIRNGDRRKYKFDVKAWHAMHKAVRMINDRRK